MASAYGSTVLPHRGAEVAARVGDFGGHESAAPELQAVVEDGRPGDAVGSVCTVTSRGVIRGRLLAHSAPEPPAPDCFAGESPCPVRDHEATPGG